MLLPILTYSLDDSYAVLQAVTVFVAMASRKKKLWTKIALKVTNWRPVFSNHMPSYSRDFARSIFLVVSVYGLFKLK